MRMEMKKFGFYVLGIILLFCSCNKNNEPALNIELPINAVFVPVTIEINKNDIDPQQREEIRNLVNGKHIINDVSEIPNDPIGHNEAFYKINFDDQTLLIMYLYKRWTFDTYTNRFYRNTEENTYNWVVRLGPNTDFDEETDIVQFTRFAILVRKLPVGADVQTWYSLDS